MWDIILEWTIVFSLLLWNRTLFVQLPNLNKIIYTDVFMGEDAHIYNLLSNDSEGKYRWRDREKTNIKKC